MFIKSAFCATALCAFALNTTAHAATKDAPRTISHDTGKSLTSPAHQLITAEKSRLVTVEATLSEPFKLTHRQAQYLTDLLAQKTKTTITFAQSEHNPDPNKAIFADGLYLNTGLDDTFAAMSGLTGKMVSSGRVLAPFGMLDASPSGSLVASPNFILSSGPLFGTHITTTHPSAGLVLDNMTSGAIDAHQKQFRVSYTISIQGQKNKPTTTTGGLDFPFPLLKSKPTTYIRFIPAETGKNQYRLLTYGFSFSAD